MNRSRIRLQRVHDRDGRASDRNRNRHKGGVGSRNDALIRGSRTCTKLAADTSTHLTRRLAAPECRARSRARGAVYQLAQRKTAKGRAEQSHFRKLGRKVATKGSTRTNSRSALQKGTQIFRLLTTAKRRTHACRRATVICVRETRTVRQRSCSRRTNDRRGARGRDVRARPDSLRRVRASKLADPSTIIDVSGTCRNLAVLGSAVTEGRLWASIRAVLDEHESPAGARRPNRPRTVRSTTLSL